jgi:hypothetical protein
LIQLVAALGKVENKSCSVSQTVLCQVV